MATFAGLTLMLKSDIFAGTEVVASLIMFVPVATTVPPLKVASPPVAVGATTMVIVAVEPDCRDGILQITLVVVEPPLQVPLGEALAETKVSGTSVTLGLKLSVTEMFVARSGPPLVRV